MAKKQYQNEISVIWVIVTCLGLYTAICYFNGPSYQRELSQESVHKFAGIVSVAWFFISILIVQKQGTKVIFFKSKKKKVKTVISAGSFTKYVTQKEDYIVLKDPATGAESLFNWDSSSNTYVSEDGNSVLDPSHLEDWFKQRSNDRSWTDKENEKLKNREGWLDQKISAEEKKFKEEEARIEKETAEKLKNLEKYGSYTDDPEKIRQIIQRNRDLAVIEARRQSRLGNTAGFFEDAFTVLSKTCDYSIDVLAELTGSVGKHVIKNIYIVGRNAGSRWSDAINYEKDEWEAIKRSGIDSVIEIGQNYAGKNYKMIANVGGDALKGGLEAYEKGESVLEGVLEGSASGFIRTKAGNYIDSKFGELSNEFMKGEARRMEVLRGKLSSGQISENVYKGIRSVQNAKNVRTLKIINKGVKTVVNDMVNDLTDWAL